MGSYLDTYTIEKEQTMKKVLFILYTLCILYSPVGAQQIPSFKANDGVVFLGNSITEGGHYHSYIWLYYMTHFPDLPLRIYNGGIGGDCVNNMVFRFESDIKVKKPSYLICSFGMNDSGYDGYNKPEYKEYSKQQVERTRLDFETLQQQILADKRIKNVVLLGTSPYDENVKLEGVEALHGKNETIKGIIEMQADVARSRKWGFVNFNPFIGELNQQVQRSDSSATFCGGDRIHPDKDGHMIMAYLFLKAQGLAGKEVAYFQINATDKKIEEERNCRISHIKQEGNLVSFNYLSRSLPFPIDTIPRWGTKGTARDAIKQIPFMQEMNQEIMKVTGLQGRFKVSIDGVEIGQWYGNELAKGINLAEITFTPQYQQSLSIMYLNEERCTIERRLRQYMAMQYVFFKNRGLLFADNKAALDAAKAERESHYLVKYLYSNYTQARLPQVREAWKAEMDQLIAEIYRINKPVKRLIKIERIKE